MFRLLSAKVNSFFSEGHERTLRAKKNIAITFLIRGVSVVAGFIIISISIKFVNPIQYGIWLTLSSIISWFAYFDVGLGNGLKNKLAESAALSQQDKSKTYVSTTYFILIIISVIIFALFFIANHFINWNSILNTTNYSSNLNDSALLLIAIFCFQFIIQIINTVLAATHDVAKVSWVYLLGQIVSLTTIYILSKQIHGTLIHLIMIVAGLPVIVQFIASIWYYNTKLKPLAPSFKLVRLKYARYLLGIGGAFFFIQIGSLILFQTDSIIITQLFHPQEVTVFNVAFKLFSVITMIFTIIMTPFWSAFTDAYTKGDFEWLSNSIKKMRVIWCYVCLVSVSLLLASSFIYRTWLHGTVNVPFLLSFAMCLYVMAYSWMMLHCYLVNGIGKIRLQVYMYTISIFVNVPMALFSGKHLGVAGVTFSNFVIFVIMGFFLWLQCQKILNKSAGGVWDK